MKSLIQNVACIINRTNGQLTSSSCGRAVLASRLKSACVCGFLYSLLSFLFKLDLRRLFALWAIPVINHLGRKDSVKCEARNKPIENELVWDFLERGEYAGERAESVVEDLSFC